MGKVLVRGSINIDEFFIVPHIVRPGETLSSTSYSRRAGGKGANAAVSLALAGAEVDFAGSVGTDGEWLRELLSQKGVGTNLLQTDEEKPTGRAIIQLDAEHENSIVLLAGSNHSSVTLPALEKYTHLLVQNEIPLPATLDALKEAKRAGLKTVWNPSPMPSVDTLKGIEWDSLDWVVVNEGEAAELLAALGAREASAEQELLDRFEGVEQVKGIVITLGSKGACARWKGEDKVVVPAGKVVGGVKDTTGAGDCFTGYFVASLAALEKDEDPTPKKLEETLKLACQAAAMAVEKEGAMESAPKLEEVKKRLGGS